MKTKQQQKQCIKSFGAIINHVGSTERKFKLELPVNGIKLIYQ